MHYFGFLLFIPMMGLLSLSFFVLFTVTKTDKARLISFGRILAIALWIVAVVIFVAAIRIITTPHTVTEVQDMLRK